MKPKETSAHYILSSSPHTHANSSVSRIMLDVIIALLPTTAAGIVFFGMPAVWTIAVCVSTCVLTEALCRMAMKRESTIGDLSAVVTGLLLALNLPAGIPLWMAVVGSVFAIGIAKQGFGGLGMNPFNPALAARAFMLISFTGPMTTWLKPFWWRTPEAMTTATPLATMKTWFAAEATASASPHGLCSAAAGGFPGLCNMAIGNIPGCIGEVSAVALALGAAYLLWRKVITWHIPVSFIATVFVYSLIAGGAPAMAQVLTGGVMIGACFMATDYVTSPTTAKGKLIFGFGCGFICMLIRQFGSYPEGCSFAILIMNAVCPLINRWTQPKPFGSKK
ncbi:MAG: RnfABCDGE type electron transport complex subunit D [Kiritimatiellae bacterium]|nr:RnfABCDGE type electron transport complex subunit D [Kiritimatiellia bacterium]